MVSLKVLPVRGLTLPPLNGGRGGRPGGGGPLARGGLLHLAASSKVVPVEAWGSVTAREMPYHSACSWPQALQ